MSDSNRTIKERRYVPLPPAFADNDSGLPEKVFRLRKRLFIKAKQEPKFRFYALYDRIYRPDVLAAAWDRVAENDGAPGVDGVSIQRIADTPGGVEGLLQELHETLKDKRYRAQAVKRVWIEKENGGQRPLGIPTVRDRVVQTAVKLVVEPIFEADFVDDSYGFRPGRCQHDALDAIEGHLKAGYQAVYDADLQGYFDSIPHDKLMACLEMRIADRSVLKLIRQWLRAPIVDDDEAGRGGRKQRQGTPQGGVLSPLLANLYLHWLDKRFHGRDGPARFANAKLVRYADDFVILARYQGARLQDWVQATVEDWMGLKLNRAKTRIVKLDEPGARLDFLGYTFRFAPDRFGRPRRYLRREPSAKACATAREAIRQLVHGRRCHVPLPELIAEVNDHQRGWYNYFQHGHSRPAARRMNWFVLQRFTQHLKRRSQRPYRPPDGVSYYAHLHQQLGLICL